MMESRIEIVDVQWRPRLDVSGVIRGHKIYPGGLELLLDQYPEFNSYRKIGNYFWAEDYPFVRVYLHKPGTRDGFAGRKIELVLEDGSTQAFNGSLWDPIGFNDTSSLPAYSAVSITTSQKVMEDGHTFSAGYVLEEAWNELRERATLIRVNGFKSNTKICSVCDYKGQDDDRCQQCKWAGPTRIEWLTQRYGRA